MIPHIDAVRGGRNVRAMRDQLKARRDTNDPMLCDYCGDPADTVDHIHPVALGGDDTIGNLAYACSNCNAEKAAYTMQHWAIARSVKGKTPRPVHTFDMVLGLSHIVTGELFRRGHKDPSCIDRDALEAWYTAHRDSIRATGNIPPIPAYIFKETP